MGRIIWCHGCFCLCVALVLIYPLVNYLVHLFVQMHVFSSQRVNLPHTVTLMRILITTVLCSQALPHLRYPSGTPSAFVQLFSYHYSGPFSVPGFPLLFHCALLYVFLPILQSMPCHHAVSLSLPWSVWCLDSLFYWVSDLLPTFHLLFFLPLSYGCVSSVVLYQSCVSNDDFQKIQNICSHSILLKTFLQPIRTSFPVSKFVFTFRETLYWCWIVFWQAFTIIIRIAQESFTGSGKCALALQLVESHRCCYRGNATGYFHKDVTLLFKCRCRFPKLDLNLFCCMAGLRQNYARADSTWGISHVNNNKKKKICQTEPGAGSTIAVSFIATGHKRQDFIKCNRS